MRLFPTLLAALALAQAGAATAADGPRATLEAVERAADALGGRARVMALKSLEIEGQGQLAYEPGGGAVAAAAQAPANSLSVTSRRTIAFDGPRMRFEERRTQNFVFANARNMLGHVVVDQRLYGSAAYDRGGERFAPQTDAVARTRRMEMLGNPVSIVRAALAPGARVSALTRDAGAARFVLTTDAGDTATVGLDAATGRPAWIEWAAPHANLGQATYRTRFTGYLDMGGLVLPTGYTTTIDFHDLTDRTLSVAAYRFDGEVALPAGLPAAPAAETASRIETRLVAPGVWYLRPPAGANSVLVELADHLVLFELPASGERASAIVAAARAAVPTKPLTELVVTHQHYGHSAGLRTAVAEGLTIVTQAANGPLFREIVARRGEAFPDALSRAPRPLKLRLIEDAETLGVGERTLQLFHVKENTHMAGGLMAYAPWAKAVIQADLFDVGWDLYWWGQTYRSNVARRRIDPTLDIAIHGVATPYGEAVARIDRLIADTAALCRNAEEARRPLQGCPIP